MSSQDYVEGAQLDEPEDGWFKDTFTSQDKNGKLITLWGLYFKTPADNYGRLVAIVDEADADAIIALAALAKANPSVTVTPARMPASAYVGGGGAENNRGEHAGS